MKKIVLFCLIASLFGAARAEYLYWQVSSSDTASLGSTYYNAARISFTPAYDGSTVLSVQDEVAGAEGIAFLDTDTGVIDGISTITAAMVGSTTYSYFIELINYSSSSQYEVVAQSATFTYADLAAKNGCLSGSSITIQPIAWHGGSFVAAPEPTSAVLLVVGLGLMALKRKVA